MAQASPFPRQTAGTPLPLRGDSGTEWAKTSFAPTGNMHRCVYRNVLALPLRQESMQRSLVGEEKGQSAGVRPFGLGCGQAAGSARFRPSHRLYSSPSPLSGSA